MDNLEPDVFRIDVYADAVAFEPFVRGVHEEVVVVVGAQNDLIVAAFVDGRNDFRADDAVFLVVHNFDFIERNRNFNRRFRLEIVSDVEFAFADIDDAVFAGDRFVFVDNAVLCMM